MRAFRALPDPELDLSGLAFIDIGGARALHRADLRLGCRGSFHIVGASALTRTILGMVGAAHLVVDGPG